MNIRKYAKVAAIPAGLLVSGLVVAQTSSAAFTAQTTTEENSWSSGKVTLTNDHAAKAVFNADKIVPGDSDSQTVEVTYDGDVEAGIKLFAVDTADDTGALAEALQLTITQGATQVYTGSLADFATKTSSATGVGTWEATGSGGETKDYTIAWSLPSSVTSSDVQGADASLVFAWEATSISS